MKQTTSIRYFLAKVPSHPFMRSRTSKRDKKTVWDGVRNPQALRAIMDMQPGDRVFIYHSGGVSAIVGVAKVLSSGRPDPKDPKSAVVDLEFVSQLDFPSDASPKSETSENIRRLGPGSAGPPFNNARTGEIRVLDSREIAQSRDLAPKCYADAEHRNDIIRRGIEEQPTERLREWRSR